MRYEEIASRTTLDFKRLTGVERHTFEAMLKCLKRANKNFGRPMKLSEADQLLLALLYWREHRTQYHIAADYSISEATCSRMIRRVETIISSQKQFSLPKRIPRQSSQYQLEYVVIDTSETPVRRPQKKTNKPNITVARRNATR